MKEAVSASFIPYTLLLHLVDVEEDGFWLKGCSG
jgi:hypothetical protein